MRRQNHVENTGIILSLSDQKFLGSCFVFRYPNNVLTACHCIANFRPEELGVVFPGSRAGNRIFSVKSVDNHATADVAVLRIIPPKEREITWVLHSTWNDLSFGLSVFTFGYPQEWASGGSRPSPRLFKGHVQRFFEHTSHLGFTYMAAELSFACPAGLSGSPIINPELQSRLYGLVTENIRTSTEIESVLEINDGGKEYKESFHRIINYGIAVWLPALTSWLDDVVPPLTQDEINRRSNNQHKWEAEEAK